MVRKLSIKILHLEYVERLFVEVVFSRERRCNIQVVNWLLRDSCNRYDSSNRCFVGRKLRCMFGFVMSIGDHAVASDGTEGFSVDDFPFFVFLYLYVLVRPMDRILFGYSLLL